MKVNIVYKKMFTEHWNSFVKYNKDLEISFTLLPSPLSWRSESVQKKIQRHFISHSRFIFKHNPREHIFLKRTGKTHCALHLTHFTIASD